MLKYHVNDFISMIVAILLIVAVFMASMVLFLWLWKCIAVAIFGLPMLTFWQGVGLRILCSMLFKTNPGQLVKVMPEENEEEEK